MLNTMGRQLAAVSMIAACGLGAGTAAAGDLALSLNDDAARLTYAWDTSIEGLQLDAGWLHHQDRGDVANFGLHLKGDASSGASPLVGGLGGKVFFIDPDRGSADAIVLGIGGFVRYTVPQYNRFNVYAHAYFAPDVLAFGDGEQYREFEARIGYNVLRDADVFLGVRYANIEFDPAGELTMDNGLHAGIELRF